GFGLISTGETEEAQRDTGAYSLANCVPSPAAEEDQRQGSVADDLLASHLPGHVTRGDVGDLVRHRPGQLGFALGCLDQSRVNKDESPRQGKRVQLLAFYDLEGEGDGRVGVADQILAQAVDVLADDRVVEQLALFANLLGQLAAHGDLFLDRI